MLPVSLPRSITCLLDRFRGCFTTHTFATFYGLACGFWAQPGLHTVCGMLVGAQLQQAWHHARAHRFFSHARWSADQLGLVLLDLICALLVADGAPVRLVADDTLMRRSGRKVFGAPCHHDPLAPGRHRIAWANNWVVVGVLVDLPFVPHRAVCLPILARLWQPRHTPGRLDLACELVRLVCAHLGDRRVDLVCDGADAGRALQGLPAQATVCCRLRADARLHRLPPPRRPGTRGRPRTKGDRLPDLTRLAGRVTTPFALHQVTRYGHNGLAAIACFACLWPAVFGTRPVQVVLVRPPDAPDGFDLALVCTDLAATPVELVERYAARWQVEVCFREIRQDAGVGQARNRTRRAVERTVPFGLVCYSLAIVWYAQHGHHPADLAARRALAPWYQTKATPSAADMLAKLRRVLIATQYRQGHAPEPTLPEILQVQAALGCHWSLKCESPVMIVHSLLVDFSGGDTDATYRPGRRGAETGPAMRTGYGQPAVAVRDARCVVGRAADCAGAAGRARRCQGAGGLAWSSVRQSPAHRHTDPQLATDPLGARGRGCAARRRHHVP